MKEVFEQIVMRLALCGLAASLALLALRSRLVRDAFARLLCYWRSLTAFGRFAVSAFLMVGVLVGGDKTNSVPPNMSPPLLQMQHGGVSLTGLAFAQGSFAERWAQNWNVCGAWRDSLWLPFEDGWVFPHGTNHLSGVEVVSYGQVWPTPFDTNAVAAIGVPVEIVPGLSSFGYELTPSNSYRFAWTDAAIGRDTNNLVSASVELFRNGDVSVATNGVAALLPRELPFSHSGFGQDDEWVAANFTNAAEILSVGYPAWVDAQVGTGLTNGLYKLTVALADDPPETTLITVGDLSVAVTNAGEYVFLLDKGTRYDLSASSDGATGFLYSAVDDVAEPARLGSMLRILREGDDGDGTWSSDSGELRLFAPFGFVEWHPALSISPSRWHPSRANAVRSFTATLTDIPRFASPSYAWSSTDAEVCSCEGSSERTATFACHFPAAYGSTVSLGLDVTLNRTTLHADYSRHIGYFSEAEDYEGPIDDCEGDGPGPNLVVSASPSVVFFENGSTNVPCSEVGCFYLATEPGTFSLTLSGDDVSVMDQQGSAVSSGYEWDTDGGVVGARHFLVESAVKSSSPSGTTFTVTFTPDEGTNTMTGSSSVTFVEVSVVAKSKWPSTQERRRFGVFEEAYIYLMPMIQGLQLSCGGMIAGNGSWCYDYTAPGNATVDVIRNSDGVEVCSLDIVAPFGYEAVITQVIDRATEVCEAGAFELNFKLDLLPKTVSFTNIEVMEQGMAATNPIGYFSEVAHTNLLSHSHLQGAWRWIGIGSRGNDAGEDRVGVLELPQPWNAGGFMAWPIPNVYRQKGGSWISEPFCNTDQSVTLESNGTVWLEKFDFIESCTTNRHFSGWIRTNQ